MKRAVVGTLGMFGCALFAVLIVALLGLGGGRSMQPAASLMAGFVFLNAVWLVGRDKWSFSHLTGALILTEFLIYGFIAMVSGLELDSFNMIWWWDISRFVAPPWIGGGLAVMAVKKVTTRSRV
ncbi:hypothetical protein [Prosthecobacter sp.]|uniref:hypothetical protein n=1 Tax=Prosthecobacter sp. TaxID=1965333 RepID=UPI0037830FD3